METIENVQTDLKTILSERRYNHSIGTMKTAIKLAKIYGVDTNIAGLTALAHDIAKEISNEEKINYVKKNNIEVDDIEKYNIGLLHGKIGADMCKKYGFTKEMQEAIKYHTTAHTDMSVLAKIVFIADKIEENRNYEGVEELREQVKEDLDDCMLAILNHDLKKNINKGVLLHPDSIFARNQLILKNYKK